MNWLLALFTVIAVARPAAAAAVEPQDLKTKSDWLAGVLAAGAKPESLPFSFKLGDQDSPAILAAARRAETTRRLDAARTQHVVTWSHDASGLEVRWVVTDYADYPTVDWTLCFKNTAAHDAPALTEVRAIAVRFRRDGDGEFALHAFAGSTASPGDYAPRLERLGPGATATLHSNGYPTQEDLPYFNVDWGGAGAVVAIGWPGSWTASLARGAGPTLDVRGGMTRLAVALRPGEQVRSPLIALQWWKGGDWLRAQNVWRRWMVAHNLPRPGGRLPEPFTATCVDGMFPGMRSNARDEIASLEKYLQHDSPLDYFWIDAGWYPCGNDWSNVGTWEPDPARYPHGIKEVSDAVHARHMKQVVWHEPERVSAGSWLAEHHPEWVIGGKAGGLLNLGDPDAWKWVVEHFDGLIVAGGIDLYRQDYNINPASYWAKLDREGRVGVAEIRYVEGYLAYWDELLRRHPGLLIDSCASGGRRNDLETLRRSVPLLRSDYRFEPNGTQGHNYGISFWMPFNGTGVEPADPYVMRSHFCACFGYGGPCNDPHFDFEGRNRIAREWRQVAHHFVRGDYYPLTPYSLDGNVWMAWQFGRPETGGGVVQAFRRAKSTGTSARYPLRGLDPAATYEVRSLDPAATTRATGRELMTAGLEVNLPAPASAVTFAYAVVR